MHCTCHSREGFLCEPAIERLMITFQLRVDALQRWCSPPGAGLQQGILFLTCVAYSLVLPTPSLHPVRCSAIGSDAAGLTPSKAPADGTVGLT